MDQALNTNYAASFLAIEKIHSQMDLYLKKTKADYVIDSKGSFEETKNQVLEIIKKLKGF